MFWADKITKELDKTAKHRVDDMKTPSGHAHAGSLRAIGTHGLIYEAMKRAGFKVDFTYVINDMDPMDGMPIYIDKKKYEKEMGKPVFMIPAPDGRSKNFSEQYAQEYIEAFNKLGFKPKIFRSSQLYSSGRMNKWIQKSLDGVEEIRQIYLKIAKQKKPKGWYPFQVICPDCGVVGASLVTDWDGKEVSYECKEDLVTWTKGCGKKGKISPFDGNGKLMWKVDWGAHWRELEITVEGAGKDHMTMGGSHDVARAIVKKVFGEKPPFKFTHEFLLIGGAKMSSSKGNATSAADLVSIIPPELGRFLLARVPYRSAINFDPNLNNTIPDLFDDYDKAGKEWYKNKEKSDPGMIYMYSQLEELPSKPLFTPRFRQVATLMQMPSINLVEYFKLEKKSSLSEAEKKVLEKRVKYAKIWLENYADEKEKYEIKKELPERAKDLNESQKEFLHSVADFIEKGKFESGEKLQFEIFEMVKAMKLSSSDAFRALYISLMNKEHGPKMGWVLYDLIQTDRSFLLKRLREV